jgi:hypothetical protein
MTSHTITAWALGSIFAMAATLSSAQSADAHEQCSRTKPNEDAHAAMMTRGEHAMGFSQTATTHHFVLKPDGGVISVSANKKSDAASRDQIRMHLRHIAKSFSEGNFDIPMFVHDQELPGVPVMKRLSQQIRYQFRKTDRGAEVLVSSKSEEAIQAVHEFLIFQIREHKTGDPMSLP